MRKQDESIEEIKMDVFISRVLGSGGMHIHDGPGC